MALRPDRPADAVKAYGLSLLARNTVVKARALRRALALAPQGHEARLALGRLQIEAGELSAAYETLARIPAASAQSRAARFLQGVSLFEIGRYPQAVDLYQRLVREEATPAALNNHAVSLIRAGADDPPPSKLLRMAVDGSPSSSDLAFNLGSALLLEGDYAGAEAALRPLVRKDPLDGPTRLALAWALRKAGRTADADQEWKGVVAMAPSYELLVNPDPTRRLERILLSERILEVDRGMRSDTDVAAGLAAHAERLMMSASTSVSAPGSASRSGDADGVLREWCARRISIPRTGASACSWRALTAPEGCESRPSASSRARCGPSTRRRCARRWRSSCARWGAWRRPAPRLRRR